LQVLDLSNNNISEIKGIENVVNLKNLEKLYLGKNPIYKNFENIFAKKKKLRKMTGGGREKAGVDPKIWEVVTNSRFELLTQPPKLSKEPRNTLKTKQKNTDSGRGYMCVFLIIPGGIVGGVISLAIFGGGASSFGTGFGVGILLCIFLLIYLDANWFDIIPYRKSELYEEVEEVEEVEVKDDYKNLVWLRYQHYELGKNVQDIASEQGVSMITIRKWIDKLKKR